MDQLSTTHYDVVVLGTGLVESIAAAALARAGKSVLHVDANKYYGGNWAAFSYDALLQWAKQNEAPMVDGSSDGQQRPLAAHFAQTNQARYTNVRADEYAWPDATEVSASLASASRQYALELAPKLLAANGELVDLLVASDIGKYLEFRLLEAVYLLSDDQLERVPSSKEAVFSSKTLTLVEKRKLMKFLMFAGAYTGDETALDGFAERPYADYLAERFGLAPRLAAAIEHAVTLKPPLQTGVTTHQGITYTRDYLRSFGRFGPSSLLCTVYGGSEIVQAFCRVCAVFGGTYILGYDVVDFELSNDDAEQGVAALSLSNGQRITFDHLVSAVDYLPTAWQHRAIADDGMRVLRMVTVLDGSLAGEEAKTAVINFAPHSSAGNAEPVIALQMDSETHACPAGQRVVYAWTKAGDTAHDALDACMRTLFRTPDSTAAQDGTDVDQRPRALFSLRFEEHIRASRDGHSDSASHDTGASSLPAGVHVCDDPDADLDFGRAVRRARAIFDAITPGAEFLPKAPPVDDDDL
ncbi:GDP dissociation inhibitor-domain-containing protein [Thamnocephalis sphaerospora]|uniref:Rab escort protein 1 n=1 Tax=Thamnocephalis sphaerospora TaxID=78915 RepID=A0A4P9XM69_9FUNG|nr:GDP dissociation inhibitor-domain-containing protein [Thamnocephalis sphaerospora]|eukprot:RKP06942.1 GDP dissociation inhibitor-domain-containing protein [Thamnocephalis sphaerospora]